jgi:hypothetical protein
MARTVTVTPAYGRDYKSAKGALADWYHGKDFILQDVQSRYDGKPINLCDASEAGLKVKIRFANNRKVVMA